MNDYDKIVDSHEYYPIVGDLKDDEGDMPGHELMTQRMISAHWASLSEDVALRYIEGILEATPPTHVLNSFTTRRWQAEQIYNLVYLGVLPDNRGGT